MRVSNLNRCKKLGSPSEIAEAQNLRPARCNLWKTIIRADDFFFFEPNLPTHTQYTQHTQMTTVTHILLPANSWPQLILYFSSLLSHVRISHPDRSRLFWHDHHLRCHIPVRECKRASYVQSSRKARGGCELTKREWKHNEQRECWNLCAIKTKACF